MRLEIVIRGRYHLVIPTVPRKTLSKQELACCDNNRTSVIFQGDDIYCFVGDIELFESSPY